MICVRLLAVLGLGGYSSLIRIWHNGWSIYMKFQCARIGELPVSFKPLRRCERRSVNPFSKKKRSVNQCPISLWSVFTQSPLFTSRLLDHFYTCPPPSLSLSMPCGWFGVGTLNRSFAALVPCRWEHSCAFFVNLIADPCMNYDRRFSARVFPYFLLFLPFYFWWDLRTSSLFFPTCIINIKSSIL